MLSLAAGNNNGDFNGGDVNLGSFNSGSRNAVCLLSRVLACSLSACLQAGLPASSGGVPEGWSAADCVWLAGQPQLWCAVSYCLFLRSKPSVLACARSRADSAPVLRAGSDNNVRPPARLLVLLAAAEQQPLA